MFEFLLDSINGQVEYSMYVGILIGLTAHFISIFKLELKFNHTIHSSSDIQYTGVAPLLRDTLMHVDKRMIWIVKIVRRKKSLGEEPSEAIPSPLFTINKP